jgi:hypothetical protein
MGGYSWPQLHKSAQAGQAQFFEGRLVAMQFRLRTLTILLAIGPPLLAYWYRHSVPREVVFFFYMLIPPLVVAGVLGLWTRALFWLLGQLSPVIAQLRCERAITMPPCASTCDR